MQTENLQTPYVEIVEQPADRDLRFRYECEGRWAGAIPGVNSTPEKKTYPKIAIIGYKGPTEVIVSCVTKDEPYKPHPHRLVGSECKEGIFKAIINEESMSIEFRHLGIQCVKKKEIDAALKERQAKNVDPFSTGYEHRLHPANIDLNCVRLCFQVFIYIGTTKYALTPVVSQPIKDKKSMTDLVIRRLCTCAGTVEGNTEMILLCEKVSKADIKVRFFEQSTGWTAYGSFDQKDVHKQTAIVFRTPQYYNLNITKPAVVAIQLERISDGKLSKPYDFDYIPLDVAPGYLKQKRQRMNPMGDPQYHLMNYGGNVTSFNQMNIKRHQNDIKPYAPSILAFDNNNCNNRTSCMRMRNNLNQFHQQTQNAGNNLGMNTVSCSQMFNNFNQFNQATQYNMTYQNVGASVNGRILSNGQQNIPLSNINDPALMKSEEFQQILQMNENQIPIGGLSNLSL